MNNRFKFILKKNLRKLTEYPLVKIEDKIVNSKSQSRIPPNVYQTWETRMLGKSHHKSIDNFRNLNKNLSFYLYDKEKRDEYMISNWGKHNISDIYFKSLFGPMKADIFRYCILYEKGGYYFDISKACNIALTDLHSAHHETLITYEDNVFFYPPKDIKIYNLMRPFNYFLQWGIAFSPLHSFLKELIEEIVINYKFFKGKNFNNPKLAILNLTGPGMYTKVMRGYISKNNISNFKELDISFNGHGIFNIKGSTIRHYTVPSYTYKTNLKICN